jgi:hypothetical protein
MKGVERKTFLMKDALKGEIKTPMDIADALTACAELGISLAATAGSLTSTSKEEFQNFMYDLLKVQAEDCKKIADFYIANFEKVMDEMDAKLLKTDKTQ